MRLSLFIFIAALSAAGCGDAIPVEMLRRQGIDTLSRDATFRSAADLLDGLDQANIIEFDRTTVIVDRTTSTDNQPVLATITRRTGAAGAPFDQLQVPAKNVDFIKLKVKPNDNLYYLLPGVSQEAAPAAGLKQRSLDFRVAEVVDAHTLRLHVPVTQESPDPQPIVVTRRNNDRLDRATDRIRQFEKTGQPPMGWEPTPDEDALDELVLRFNRWLQTGEFPQDWPPDPWLKEVTLFDEPAERESLAALRFAREEGRLLQESLWLRDISRRASGEPKAMAQAEILFDWVVRNLQLESPGWVEGLRLRPWQALALGRATADERAWTFVLLLRQIKLDAVVLALPGKTADAPPVPWCVAVLIGDAAYLFDPALGLPLPGKDGQGIATLADLRGDEAMLRQLDLNDKERYPITTGDLNRLIALVEVSPLAVSRRAQLVEAQFAGRQQMVLATAPGRTVERVRSMKITDIRPWTITATTEAAQRTLPAAGRGYLARQFNAFAIVSLLWKGRVVQIKGDPYRWELDPLDRRVRVYARNQDPRQFYLSDQCCPPEVLLEQLDRDRPFAAEAFRIAQQFARYQLGHVTYEAGDYTDAIIHFRDRTLKFHPRGPYVNGARYNLARTHEQLARQLREAAAGVKGEGAAITLPIGLLQEFGDKPPVSRDAIIEREKHHEQQARELYEQDTSPQRHGNRLRAKRLLP